MSERMEIDRSLRGRNLIEQVNKSLMAGHGVDANTYFEAITESEDVIHFHDLDWPKHEARAIYNRSLGGDKLLDANNSPIRDGMRQKSKKSVANLKE